MKDFIHKKFKIKDWGQLRFFLCLEVAKNSFGIFLNQRKYVIDLLSYCDMNHCKPATSHIVMKHQLACCELDLLLNLLDYRRLIGKLIYLTITSPDLTYSVHILSQFMQTPRLDHLNAAKRVLRYLKGTTSQGLLYSAESTLQLTGFCDADWGACPVTRRSISGYCTTLGGSAISGLTNLQSKF